MSADLNPADAVYATGGREAFGSSVPWTPVASSQLGSSAIGNVAQIPGGSTGYLLVPAATNKRVVGIQNLGIQPIYISSSVVAAPGGWHVGPQTTLQVETAGAIYASTLGSRISRVVTIEG